MKARAQTKEQARFSLEPLKLIYNCPGGFSNDLLLQTTSDKTTIVLFSPQLHNGWDDVMVKRKEWGHKHSTVISGTAFIRLSVGHRVLATHTKTLS